MTVTLGSQTKLSRDDTRVSTQINRNENQKTVKELNQETGYAESACAVV